VHGKLHNSPFTYVDSSEFRLSVSKMQNGRPAEGSIETSFYENGYTKYVDSLEVQTDVSGW
jgi:hypothetical protein